MKRFAWWMSGYSCPDEWYTSARLLGITAKTPQELLRSYERALAFQMYFAPIPQKEAEWELQTCDGSKAPWQKPTWKRLCKAPRSVIISHFNSLRDVCSDEGGGVRIIDEQKGEQATFFSPSLPSLQQRREHGGAAECP